MLYLMLRREGWAVNHKRIERLYREEGLSLRKRRRRKRLSHLRVARASDQWRRIKPGRSTSFTTA
jgi:transposase InsO family protein